jgi:hypothetical protein
LHEMLNFFETMSGFYEQVSRIPTPSLIKLIKMGDRLRKLLNSK